MKRKRLRQALRSARQSEPPREADEKLEIVRAAAPHDYPTGDIDQMLGEISGGLPPLPAGEGRGEGALAREILRAAQKALLPARVGVAASKLAARIAAGLHSAVVHEVGVRDHFRSDETALDV